MTKMLQLQVMVIQTTTRHSLNRKINQIFMTRNKLGITIWFNFNKCGREHQTWDIEVRNDMT
uniref:Uncharacterized protein n=1 Tax=Rhizophora mucronata TaxID=61149 RepID=A0A2P2QD59_RHIMU